MKLNDYVPQGWLYDRADPSAGILGDQWVHEDCDGLAGPGCDEILGVSEVVNQVTDPDDHGMAKVIYSLWCRDCGQEASVVTTEFVGLEDAA